MEKIKRIILQKTKIAKVGSVYNIIPDLSVSYNIKFLLTAEAKDLGFFDVYTFSDYNTGGNSGIGIGNNNQT
jgi:hypothetical protein